MSALVSIISSYYLLKTPSVLLIFSRTTQTSCTSAPSSCRSSLPTCWPDRGLQMSAWNLILISWLRSSGVQGRKNVYILIYCSYLICNLKWNQGNPVGSQAVLREESIIFYRRHLYHPIPQASLKKKQEGKKSATACTILRPGLKKEDRKKSFTTILRPGLPSNYKSQHKCDNLNFSVYAVSASYYKNRHSGSDQCWLFCYKFALMFCLIANKCVRKQFGFYLGSVPAASIWWILKPHSACFSDLHLYPCTHF